MILTIDIGNTRIKSAVFENNNLLEVFAFDAEFLQEKILNILKKFPKVKVLVIASVGNFNSSAFSFLENDIKIKGQAQGVIICPGPNMAYFDHEVSLSKMMQHINGKVSVLGDENRPNLYVKELKMYLDYLKNEIESFSNELTVGQIKKWHAFKNNLIGGISYYEDLFSNHSFFNNTKKEILNQFEAYKKELVKIEIPALQLA